MISEGQPLNEVSPTIKGNAKENLSVYCSAQGLGDCVTAYYSSCGLANALPDNEIDLFVQYPEWLSGFSHPRVNVLPQGNVRLYKANMNISYDNSLNHGVSRKQWYAEMALQQWGLQANVTPCRPDVIPRYRNPIDHTEFVVIAPFSDFSARNWPIVHWIRLAVNLCNRGLKVIAIGRHRDQLEEAFGSTRVEYYYGMPPTFVMALLANASLVIGNDSGIPHLSGLLGTRTISILSQLSPYQVFSHTDIQCITPTMSCSPCFWNPNSGFLPSCDSLSCSALHTVSPEVVLHRALSLMLRK